MSYSSVSVGSSTSLLYRHILSGVQSVLIVVCGSYTPSVLAGWELSSLPIQKGLVLVYTSTFWHIRSVLGVVGGSYPQCPCR